MSTYRRVKLWTEYRMARLAMWVLFGDVGSRMVKILPYPGRPLGRVALVDPWEPKP